MTGRLYPGADVLSAQEGVGIVDPDCPAPGGAPTLPPRGQGGNRSGVTRIIIPPWMEKLAGSLDFYAADFNMVLPPGVGSTVVSPNLATRLVNGQVGWLQIMTQYVLNPVAAFQAEWQLLINRQPVEGFSTLRNAPMLANVFYLGYEEMQIRIPSGAEVTVRIVNRSAVGSIVGGEIAGWYHPESTERQAWGLGV